jgi:hypothetical protein
MRVIQGVSLLGLLGAFFGAFAWYPAVPTVEALYPASLTFGIVCLLASSVGVRGTTSVGGQVQVPVSEIVRSAPRWCLVVAAAPVATLVYLLVSQGPVSGSLTAAELTARPVLGRLWLLLVASCCGVAVALAGASLATRDAWLKALDD